jgi:hypothetical protein
MLTPAELVALPKSQAFALLEGGQLWKLRIPLPDASQDPVMPESLTAIANEMERTLNHQRPLVPDTGDLVARGGGRRCSPEFGFRRWLRRWRTRGAGTSVRD